MIVKSDKESFLAYYQNAFEGALLCADGQILACNRAAEKILHLPAEKIVGEPLTRFFGSTPLQEGELTLPEMTLDLRIARLENGFALLFVDKTRQKELREELESTLIVLDTITRAGSDFILSREKENLDEVFAELLAGLEAVCKAESGVLTALPLLDEEFSPYLEKAIQGKMALIEDDVLAVPLLSRGEVIGVMGLRRSAPPFSHEEIRLILPMIQMAILFIEGHRLEHERKENELLLEKARDEALQASRAKSSFLANMSHEIRTPLNAVMGMTELLLNTELTEAQQNLAEKTYSSAEILLHILNDILDISKIEAGQMVLESLPFSLKKVLSDVEDLVAVRAEKKGLTLSISCPDEIDQLLGDPTRLCQILTNLAGNAVKFTEKGSISITVAETPQGMLLFSVKDSGIGIKKNRQEHIFEVFTQEDSSTTRKFGGTGLGLSICKQLVEAMGGTIGVESTEGKGSTFTFTLPYRKSL